MVDHTNFIGTIHDGLSGERQREANMDPFDSTYSFLDNTPSPPDFCRGLNATSSMNQGFNSTTWWDSLVQSSLLDWTNCDHTATTKPMQPTLGVLDSCHSGSQAFLGVNSLGENGSLSSSLTDPGASEGTNLGDPVAGETPFGAKSPESVLPKASMSQSRAGTKGNAPLIKDNDTPGWVSLIKPRPQAGEDVITLRRETHVALDITIEKLPGLPPTSCNGIKIPATGSVKNYADTTGKNLLEFRVRLYGAATKRRYENVCTSCEKREGMKKGILNVVDFYAARDIIEPKDGKIRVEFSFCCYPKCHQSGDSGYLLEVVLAECMDPNRIVAQYQFAVSFNVVARFPRGLKKPPPAGGKRSWCQMEQLEVTPPVVDQRNIRPRFNDSSRQGSPSDEQADNPSGTNNPHDATKCGLQPNSSPSGPSLLMPPLWLASSICPSPESLSDIIPLGRTMSPPRIDGGTATVLMELNPESGSITGGAKVWIKGTDFPATLPLYARFGTSIVPTTFSASNLLSCQLPSTNMPGVVNVTLSTYPHQSAPEYGTSIAKFQYLEDYDQLIHILLRVQGKGYPESPIFQALLTALNGT